MVCSHTPTYGKKYDTTKIRQAKASADRAGKTILVRALAHAPGVGHGMLRACVGLDAEVFFFLT